MSNLTRTAYDEAKKRYALAGIDTDTALKALSAIPVSMHCWQGDDVAGFEMPDVALSGGIQTTGNYPGKAKTAAQLRQDAEQAMALIPGAKRFNLHAIYLDTEEKVARDKIEPKHFKPWVDWAKKLGIGLDFNPSCFSHPNFVDGMTLAHPDEKIRRFWIDHCIACRRISDYFGEELGTPCAMNIWIPDGMKDQPADRSAPRERLLSALDEIINADVPNKHHVVAVEGKLFGIGAESYTVGSNEFYMAYAVSRKTALCLDAGHFHPTEIVSDKITAVMPFIDTAKRLPDPPRSSSADLFTPEKDISGHCRLPLTRVRSPLTENSVFISCQRSVTSSSPISPAGTSSVASWPPIRPCTVVSVGAVTLARSLAAFSSRPSRAKRVSTTAAARRAPASGP